MEEKNRTRLGQLLVDNELITSEQLEIALKRQEETGELLGGVLLKLGFIDEESVLLPILANQLDVPLINIKQHTIPVEVVTKLPASFVTFYKVVPFEFADETLRVATVHPHDIHLIDALGLATPYKIATVLAAEKDIGEAIRKYYGIGADTIDQMMDSVQTTEGKGTSVENIEEIDSEASIGKFINQILLEAFKDRATDIHIEPFESDLKIRYRIDGILHDARIPANLWLFKDSINSRIKIMSNLNIAEKRLPQDGRFKVKVGEHDLDLRVSFLPTPYGESVVIRILSSSKLYHLKDLGVTQAERDILNDLIMKPHGIIFVTGPTGSGKTTTLYACLSSLNKADRKIITIEDPIEYQLGGTTQIQINPSIGLSFSAGLRSMLRHDPDIMMVGEVRDKETAEIAVQIAMTGHLVFSTLHTNDAASGATRLIDMGVEPYLLSSSVECFIAQRLIRMICPKCKVPTKLSDEILKEFSGLESDFSQFTFYEGKGCEHCAGMGYYGREGIYEFLLLSDEIRSLIDARASSSQIKAKAVQLGMKTLLQHGWQKVKEGLTTAQEVIRVTNEEIV